MACEIRVRRELLNPRFEGYKLSLDDFPVKQIPTRAAVYEVPEQPDLFSLQHFKIFSPWNCLYLDPHIPKTVYYVNSQCEIVCHALGEGSPSERSGFVVAKLPHSDSARNFHVSLLFPDSSSVIISDGNSGLLIGTVAGGRANQNESSWKLQEFPYHSSEDFRLLTARMGENTNKTTLDIVLVKAKDKGADVDMKASGDQKKSEKASPQFVTVLEWISLEQGERSEWTVSQTRRFEGSTAPHYVALEKNGAGLSIAGESSFSLVFDSENSNLQMELEAIPQPELSYTWNQTDDEVTVFISVPEQTQKGSLKYKLNSSRVELEDGMGKKLLFGDLCGTVDPELSTWVLTDGRIEVLLSKKVPTRWGMVLLDDSHGVEIPTEDDAKEISEKLGCTTSEDYLDTANNPQQLEECDDFPEDAASWIRFDGRTNRITHKADISSHQYLFNVTPNPDQMPGLCLRHDVDGLVFAAAESVNASDLRTPPWDHIGTFDALGEAK